MRSSGPVTIIEFNKARLRVLSLAAHHGLRPAHRTRYFSLPITGFDDKASLLLVRHLRAHRLTPRRVRLVLPRPMARWYLSRYSHILGRAGILPECVLLQSEGWGGGVERCADLIPDDLRQSLRSHQEHLVWRRRTLMFLAVIFLWCILLLSLVRGKELELSRMVQAYRGYQKTAALLVREEGLAAFKRDVVRDGWWRRRLEVIFGALPASASLRRVRLDGEDVLDLVGETGDPAALMVYAEALKEQGDFPGLVWEASDMSKQGAMVFRITSRNDARRIEARR